MRRAAFVATVSILLGVLTVGGAIVALSHRVDSPQSQDRLGIDFDDEGCHWFVGVSAAFGWERVSISRMNLVDADPPAKGTASPEQVLPQWARPNYRWYRDNRERWPLFRESPSLALVSAGWPWRAAWCEYHWTEQPPSTNGGFLIHTASKSIVFPCLPRWHGLLLDTVFYAAIWSLILFAPGPLRRALRRRRGLCARCAYDLKHDLPGGCPECGWGRSGTLAR